MKVFISSLISGFEEFRAAAVAAVTSLGHEPITAETFGAGTTSPRVACLQGVRQADVVVLLLGGNYGVVQPVSGISATHEEYREAKDRRPVIAFVQEGVHPEPQQAEFIREVQDWSGGLFRGGFRSAEALRTGVTQALHRHELATASAPVDVDEMLARAIALLPVEHRGYIRTTGPLLNVTIVGGPAQTILRPVEIERPEFARQLMREATYGDASFLDPQHGTTSAFRNGSLRIEQPTTEAAIEVDERGSIRLGVPIDRSTGSFPVLIDENVSSAISTALSFTNQLLAQIDETQKLTRVVIAAEIGSGSGIMGWRTAQEDAASPTSMSASYYGGEERRFVHFQPADRARASLAFDQQRITEDLVTLLRRKWR